MKESYSIFYLNFKDSNKFKLTERQRKNLESLNIYSLYDAFYFFPRAYDNRTNNKKISELRGNEYVVIKAKVLSISSFNTRTSKKMTRATISDESGVMEILWFSMPYLKKYLKVGQEYFFIGEAKKNILFQMINPEFKVTQNLKNNDINSILPVYSLNKNFSQNSLRKLLKKLIDTYVVLVEENIPQEILDKYNILSRATAFKEIHFPSSEKNIEEAKRRFAIEELIILEMGILKNKYELEKFKSLYSVENKKNLVKSFLNLLPFSLTLAQKKVITEIYSEILSGKIINRLIQGDVGSGKTIVAIVILIYMAENGYQGALMAPTEILAKQHFLGIKDIIEKLGLRIALLTSSVKGKKYNAIIEDIKEGKIDIVIGTHSLIEDSVKFNKLGLIVIDEQHRFGVAQRKKLRDKGFVGNLMVMSATPIPRSLALSIYGDLDLSIIDKRPPGRTSIKTKWISNAKDLKKMYSFIRKKISLGDQAYFIAPLIEESMKLNLKSVNSLYEDIKNEFPDENIMMLHGKISSSEKDKIMNDFKEKKFNILIATTVIEVGIDVPNSTIMAIYNADRFGLSALHQLRGRVGRGEKQSYCFLVSNTTNETSIQRLKIMEETEDGFKIAEEDLRLRNSGEIFGLKQSGFSDLNFIDIIYDIKTIKMVRDECSSYLKHNNLDIKNEYLQYDINKKFSSKS